MLKRVYLIVLISAIATSTLPSVTLEVNDPKHMINRVVGGFEVPPHACPWQIAYMVTYAYVNKWCGGTIICPKFVMTAYNCVDQVDPKSYRISVGVHDRNEIREGKVKQHEIARIIPHPRAPCVQQRYDFALLELKENIQFNFGARPVYLPEAADIKRLAPDSILVASGWGLADHGSVPNKLRAVSLNYLPGIKCPLPDWEDTPDKICAGIDGGGKDTCKGDSGGDSVVLLYLPDSF